MERERVAEAEEELEDDDEWMDWETRKESIPLFKHMIAGKPLSQFISSDVLKFSNTFPVKWTEVW